MLCCRQFSKKAFPAPETQLRIAGFLLVSESSKLKNKLLASLLPPSTTPRQVSGLVPPWPMPSKYPACWNGFSSWLVSSLFDSLPD